MAWQPTKPADADKIKDSASDLRDNFAAIESGDVPQEQSRLESQGSAKSAVSGSSVLYALSTDNDNVFMKNPAGVQHRIGPQFISAFGEVTDTSADTTTNPVPSLTAGTSYNIASVAGGDTPATGRYKLTFTSALHDTNYFIMINRVYDGLGTKTGGITIEMETKNTTDCTFQIFREATAVSVNFNFIIVGGF